MAADSPPYVCQGRHRLHLLGALEVTRSREAQSIRSQSFNNVVTGWSAADEAELRRKIEIAKLYSWTERHKRVIALMEGYLAIQIQADKIGRNA
jgi:hypothetical protein